jgi:hypothetical protein
MDAPIEETSRYPLLEQLSRQRGLPLLPIYKIRDAALLFGISSRTVHDWIADGRLLARDLPGRGRFLPQDLEDFLVASVRRRDESKSEPQSVHARPQKRRRHV